MNHKVLRTQNRQKVEGEDVLCLQIAVKFPVFEHGDRTGEYYTDQEVIVEASRSRDTFGDIRDVLIKELNLPHDDRYRYEFAIPWFEGETANNIAIEGKTVDFLMVEGYPPCPW